MACIRKEAVMLELIQAILFGLVEGITEWLPISSTGHMILLNEIMPLNVSEDFYSMFEVVIQLGAILAVVVLYFKQIWPFAKTTDTPLTQSGWLSHVKKPIFDLWLKILVACVPAAIVGLLLDEVLEELFYNYVVVALALIVFGVAFIIVERIQKHKTPLVASLEALDYKTVLIIGIFQLIAAIFPGTSRSGATIVGALMLGVSRSVAAEFTFFLAIPVMFGASLLKLIKFGLVFTGSEIMILLTGMVVAFITSIVVIRFLMGYIRKHDFTVFGYYRIILGIVVLVSFGMHLV